ncbi:trafficking protein particle complex subunit 5-like [Paramacrobiotus metropolitanus]|uniref:trafficking protein particle complex subunit 5-like n=1 Tax=Paramacrobiotus metropolitanus TaxID=2943436 RepID=UPI002446140B|nr:trafficking protein particle complex subunit 5-like [Paramacrobiotus metropolitanus]
MSASASQSVFHIGDVKTPLGIQTFLSADSLGSSVYDQSLKKDAVYWPINTFALLFSQAIDYYQHRVDTVRQLEERLSALGAQVGSRMLDHFMYNHQKTKREQRVLAMLVLVKGPLWKYLFGKDADQLEQSNEAEGTYYIIEKDAVTNRYISASITKEKSTTVERNCGAFLAGLVQSFLTDSGFACVVNAHAHKGTTLVVDFDKAVIAREKTLESTK